MTIDGWVLREDSEHPEGIRFLAETDPDPRGQPKVGTYVHAWETSGLDRFWARVPCLPNCCLGGDWLFGTPPRNHLALGVTDEQGTFHAVWTPPDSSCRLTLLAGVWPDRVSIALSEEAYKTGHARIELRVRKDAAEVLIDAAAKVVEAVPFVVMGMKETGANSVKELEDLAEQGNPKAQYYLGMYQRTYPRGEALLRKSAAQGYAPAKEALERMEKSRPIP